MKKLMHGMGLGSRGEHRTLESLGRGSCGNQHEVHTDTIHLQEHVEGGERWGESRRESGMERRDTKSIEGCGWFSRV